jgi:hypothetical protein
VPRFLLLGIALLPAFVVPRTPGSDELGLSGYVLNPEGTPVASGRVVLQSVFGARTMAAIEESGRFRVVPGTPAPSELFVIVSGFAPYRMRVIVPRSRTMKLPVVRLSNATYFRVRFVTADGEPIVSPRLRHQSFDAQGPISVPLIEGPSQRIESDGAITVGPLPRGLATFALDTPPLAQTRLPDLYVTGEQPLLDGGTVIVQPGAVLQVDVVDAAGAPVADHDVSLQDVRPRSPLAAAPVRTNQQGRATFERLSAGRYRIRTTVTARCANALLSIAPLVSVPRSGTVRMRLVAAGRATFRITSPLGPLRGALISASPDNDTSRVASCSGGTDADGRVTLATFPPGPAQVNVRLTNSSYVRRVDVPIDGREIALFIPEGFLPVRAVNAPKHDPINGATISWTSEGGRVEATASVVGEALLEGVGAGGGTLAVAASGYKTIEEQLPEPPAVLHEAALERTADTNLEVRVATAGGQPLPDAVVELISLDPMVIPFVATTDQRGAFMFRDAPPGSLRLTASADGFAPVVLPIPAERRGGILVTLARESQ